MTLCSLCGVNLASRSLGVCGPCIRSRADAAEYIKNAHAERWKLLMPADAVGKVAICNLCVNNCHINPGGFGLCGLRTNQNGRLRHLGGTPSKGILQWYFDPLPTNCVASWVCPECTGHVSGKNLAVFYGACTYDCLFCQNSQYIRMAMSLSPMMSAEELASVVDGDTRCVCYFGGDPTPQLPHAVRSSEMILGQFDVRICFETNGSMNFGLLRRMARIAKESGGIVKFDLKAWDENLHRALCGTSPSRTKKNFSWLVHHLEDDVMGLAASTLLVPGYIDAREVSDIASFIAELDPMIPYSLLAFYPCHLMHDLPLAEWDLAQECRKAAMDAGLKRVHIGNVSLLR